MLKRLYEWFHKVTSRPEEADEYSAGYWQDKVRTVAIELCREKKGKLLEVGCGEGLFLARLGLSNPDIAIWGVDNQVEMLNRAKKRLKEKRLNDIELLQAEATDLPFEGFFFDTVVCINVLFNMPSITVLKKSLKEMGHICKAGGHIIFDFRNALNPLLNLKYRLALYYDSSTKNLPLLTCRINEIESILNEINFQITQRSSVCFPKGRFTPIVLLEARKLK